MANPLHERATPKDLADSRQVFDLEEKIEDFERLVEIVTADGDLVNEDGLPADWEKSPVSVRLEFDWADDSRAIPVLSGAVSTVIPAICQRCLEPFSMTVRAELRLLLVGPKTAGGAAAAFEEWELEEDTLRPHDIVEEALVMALPLAATHASLDDCGESSQVSTTPAEEVGRIRPFADLRARLDETN